MQIESALQVPQGSQVSSPPTHKMLTLSLYFWLESQSLHPSTAWRLNEYSKQFRLSSWIFIMVNTTYANSSANPDGSWSRHNDGTYTHRRTVVLFSPKAKCDMSGDQETKRHKRHQKWTYKWAVWKRITRTTWRRMRYETEDADTEKGQANVEKKVEYSEFLEFPKKLSAKN